MRAERGYELFVCYGAQFRLKSLTAKWIPKDRRMVGGTFIIWVLIDFLTSLLNFLQEIYGVETNVVSRRVGVFFLYLFDIIWNIPWFMFRTFNWFLLQTKSSEEFTKSLKAGVGGPSCDMICHSSLPTICPQCFYPCLPPRVVRFAYKMMLVWLCLYCPPVPNIKQFVATINLTSLNLLGNKYLGWRYSSLSSHHHR